MKRGELTTIVIYKDGTMVIGFIAHGIKGWTEDSNGDPIAPIYYTDDDISIVSEDMVCAEFKTEKQDGRIFGTLAFRFAKSDGTSISGFGFSDESAI